MPDGDTGTEADEHRKDKSQHQHMDVQLQKRSACKHFCKVCHGTEEKGDGYPVKCQMKDPQQWIWVGEGKVP